VYPLKALMIVTYAEAISWLGLLGGMILNYGFDNPEGVSLMGPIHGFLFMGFCVLLAITHFDEQWPVKRTIMSFAESVPPFLGFLLGRRLLEEVRARDARTVATS
jgi:integral membrane protein